MNPLAWIERLRTAPPNDWLRAGIVAGVLILSYTLAPYATPRLVALLAGAVAGGAAVVIIHRRPPLGLLAVVGSLVVPLSIGTGTQTRVNLTVLVVALLAALWILDMMVRREVRLAPSATVPPLVAFTVVIAVAFVAGQVQWLRLVQTAPLQTQLGAVALFVLSFAAFLLPAHQIRDLRWLQGLVWLFLGLGAVYLFAQFAPPLKELAGKVYPSMGSLFWVWVVALGFSQAAFNRKLRLEWRLALIALVAAALFIGLFLRRDWTSGWLPQIAALLGVLWAARPRMALPITAAALGLLAANWDLFYADFVQIGGEFGNEWSLYTRLEAWRVMMDVIGTNPILGLGPANYHWYTPFFLYRNMSLLFNSHNQYLDIAAQTGVVGLACFAWFVAAVGRVGWRLRRVAPEGFARAYVYGAIGGLAGMLAAGMLVDWLIPFVYNIGYGGFPVSVLGWLFLGGLVAVEQIVRQERKDERHAA